jgi:hypothetical protein
MQDFRILNNKYITNDYEMYQDRMEQCVGWLISYETHRFVFFLLCLSLSLCNMIYTNINILKDIY